MRTTARGASAVGRRRRRDVTGFLFLLPALLIVGLLLFYPVVSSIYYSFTNKHLVRPSVKFVGLDNYATIFTDAEFWHSFLVSINWTLASLLGQVLVGFTAALALNRIRHFQGFFRTMLIIPWAFPSIVIALSWKWILNGVYGFVPNVLVAWGSWPIDRSSSPTRISSS